MIKTMFKKKKEPELQETAKKNLDPGSFNIAYTFQKEQKKPVKMPRKYTFGYLGVVLTIIVSLSVHTWAFIEQNILRQAVTPLLLFVATVWHSTAQAETKSPPKEEEKTKEKNDADQKTKEDTKASESTSKPKSASKNKIDEEFDSLNINKTRVEILSTLSEREKEINKKQVNLDSREKMVKALEKQLAQKAEDLEKLKIAVESLSRDHNAGKDKNFKNLLITYESMKPAAAAKVFNELPMETLLGIVKNMNPKKLSLIMSSMSIDKVKSLTNRISNEPLVPGEKINKE
jgi:flagellar motility protein MotE (MotC chaperone)